NTTPNAFRDLPILEANDDHLVLGRYGYVTSTPTPNNRVVVGKDPGNNHILNQFKCCFHNQAHFRVRTGGQWLTQGGAVSYLHHIVKDASGACVSTCNTRDLLLNSRVPALPYPCTARSTNPLACTAVREDPKQVPWLNRNSPLAMRNPSLSFAIYNGWVLAPSLNDPKTNVLTDQLPTRDAVWRFSTRGGFAQQSINIAASTTTVSPQSMTFVEPFQQLAIVDGASQGLVLIDLNNLVFAHDPYF
ncbi:MAG TPA: hypothetical protein VNO21_26905, partial [Polyangiaceae bacterium]|nr:hypothetical protein [Polyangiaceae bacterium]